MSTVAATAGAVAPAAVGRRPGRLLATGAGVLVGLGGAVPLYRHAVRVDAQPSPASGAPDVLVPHYATPWILAAAGAALVGLLLAVSLVTELVRRRTDAGLVPDPSVLPPAVPAYPGGDPAPLPAPGSHPDDVWRPPARATG